MADTKTKDSDVSTAQLRAEAREDSVEHKTTDDLRRKEVLDTAVTQLPNNILDKLREDEVLRSLVIALRRCEVGSFQFMGDTRTAEAAVRAAFELRRVFNSQGLDLRVMSEKEQKEWAEAQPGPAVQTNENA